MDFVEGLNLAETCTAAGIPELEDDGPAAQLFQAKRPGVDPAVRLNWRRGLVEQGIELSHAVSCGLCPLDGVEKYPCLLGDLRGALGFRGRARFVAAVEEKRVSGPLPLEFVFCHQVCVFGRVDNDQLVASSVYGQDKVARLEVEDGIGIFAP